MSLDHASMRLEEPRLADSGDVKEVVGHPRDTDRDTQTMSAVALAASTRVEAVNAESPKNPEVALQKEIRGELARLLNGRLHAAGVMGRIDMSAADFVHVQPDGIDALESVRGLNFLILQGGEILVRANGSEGKNLTPDKSLRAINRCTVMSGLSRDEVIQALDGFEKVAGYSPASLEQIEDLLAHLQAIMPDDGRVLTFDNHRDGRGNAGFIVSVKMWPKGGAWTNPEAY